MTIGLCGTNPLQRVFGQKKIEVFFFGPGSIEKALLRGCGGVERYLFGGCDLIVTCVAIDASVAEVLQL